MSAKKLKRITIAVTPSEYRSITTASKLARMSRGAWLMKATEEKLARDAKAAEGEKEQAA